MPHPASYLIISSLGGTLMTATKRLAAFSGRAGMTREEKFVILASSLGTVFE
jgi:hypothetical protein